jgi:hypothetical protein
VLADGLPIQPVGICPAVAFNLALDKVLALLPDLTGAESGLYTLAAELHDDARGQPSRAWPDAGGAGWVLDAVQDALGAGQTVRSVRLIRVITDRWRSEGNPYAAPAPQQDDASMDGAGATEQALAATWRVAGGCEPNAETLERLRALVGSGPGQGSLDRVLATINEIGRRSDRPLRPVDIDRILAGKTSMPAASPEPIPETIVAEAKPPELEQDATAEDPVLGQVTAWYLSGVSAQMTALTAEELRDLTAERRNLDVWQYAFERAKHIGNSLGRWQYVRKVVMNPDMERVEHWLESGKRHFKSKGERDGGRGDTSCRGRQAGGRGDRWTEADV